MGAAGGGQVWPDLLVDRRTVAERRITPNLDTLAIERNNIVSIRLIFVCCCLKMLRIIL